MSALYLIIHNVRSAHNVGSLLRSADGLGVDEVFLTGYTPYPYTKGDTRMPHEAKKVDAQINKTALGAQVSVKWQNSENIQSIINHLKSQKVLLAALEQTADSIQLPDFKNSRDIAIIVGSERGGIPSDILNHCDLALEIPMLGLKDSYNVAVAGAITLYHLRFGA